MIDPAIAASAIQKYEDQRIQLRQKAGFTYAVVGLIPIITTILLLFAKASGPAFFVPFSISLFFSAVTYYLSIYEPFSHLKAKMKAVLLAIFMKEYHPDISFDYHPFEQNVEAIIKNSDLIIANRFEEEDVIKGNLNDSSFYISEIHLKNKAGKKITSVFEGLLFKMTIPGRNFPASQIQSQLGILSKFFSNFQENPDFGFWYDTQNKEVFEKELAPLFPFISHLMNTHEDVRIKTEGNTITLMLESKMKFLDTPKLRIRNSFINPEYYDQLGLQLNSLLFIVESFVHGLDQTEIEERLELKALELASMHSNRNQNN